MSWARYCSCPATPEARKTSSRYSASSPRRAAGSSRSTQRGQYQTPGPDDPRAYDLSELGADVAALFAAVDGIHLLGHSFGGLIAREAVLGGCTPASLTLLSSGPGHWPGRGPTS